MTTNQSSNNENDSLNNDNDSSNNVNKTPKNRGLGYYMLDTLEWLNNPDMYQLFDMEKSVGNFCWNTDDNQFIASEYNWKERIIMDDAEEILESIQHDVMNYEKSIGSSQGRTGINELKREFSRDFIRYYCEKIGFYPNRTIFCRHFISQMNRPDRTWQAVTNIRDKINMRNKNIENKKKKNPDDSLSISTL